MCVSNQTLQYKLLSDLIRSDRYHRLQWIYWQAYIIFKCDIRSHWADYSQDFSLVPITHTHKNDIGHPPTKRDKTHSLTFNFIPARFSLMLYFFLKLSELVNHSLVLQIIWHEGLNFLKQFIHKSHLDTVDFIQDLNLRTAALIINIVLCLQSAHIEHPLHYHFLFLCICVSVLLWSSVSLFPSLEEH